MTGYREIGTAWYGRHVVIIRCIPLQNQFIGIHTSLHAPTEPPSPNCTETIAQFLSIGYTLLSTYSVSPYEVHYLLMK
ncbi:hypothetical protein [Bacillus pinisoli]|uniref:hypothetical protein n=1 Tax=Bacillus pinisoli TaxID=2901866 RepID=UPI001FF4EAB1|nr:hypothetical protein [Bacillus pinisoli]